MLSCGTTAPADAVMNDAPDHPAVTDDSTNRDRRASARRVRDASLLWQLLAPVALMCEAPDSQRWPAVPSRAARGRRSREHQDERALYLRYIADCAILWRIHVDDQKKDRRQEVAEQLLEGLFHRCLPSIGLQSGRKILRHAVGFYAAVRSDCSARHIPPVPPPPPPSPPISRGYSPLLSGQ